jgi:hypothetical protein
MARPLRLLLPCAALAAALTAGCGADFELPTETSGRDIPADSSYGMIATWTGMTGVADILLTQGVGSQLFILFNTGGTGLAPRGTVREYPLVRPDAYADREFRGLFNPVALAAGNNRIFVLDQGDTAIAHTNPFTAAWDDTIWDLSAYWRVREYGLLGGDTLSSFTDTTLAWVTGVAADAQNNVYVGGVAILTLPNQNDPRLTFRLFQYRIYKYKPVPAGTAPDPNMPGAVGYRRDDTFEIEEGSGVGSVVDPRGLTWSAAAGHALYASDYGKNWVQKLYDTGLNQGYYALDGQQTGTPFQGPLDVAVDLRGYVYAVDGGNRRVVRYDPDQNFIQRVDIEPDASNRPLQQPVCLAADDSLVYVGDPQTAQVVRYRRRK